MNLDLNIKKNLIKLAKKYDLDLLVLFGSRAESKGNLDSDYDLAFFKKI